MQIYDSAKRKKVEFSSIEPRQIKMYVCGPTVYDQIHIGNARTFFVFDIIRRYLIYKGYQVTFAQNVTDVDDKIINRAHENKMSPKELSTFYTDAFIEQMDRFGIMRPDIRPKATEEIEAMISMISQLINKGYAYESQGDVYFSVKSYPNYGEISNKHIDDLLVGARIEASQKKEDALDFVLWKAAKAGEPAWPSPWGDGRPGWHSECSAMVKRYLGTPIDIHGGGSDLQFPHHENEAAQAEACWENKLANYWMHSGMLLVNGEKMSKSLGNFYTLKEVLDTYDKDALRLLMLQTHYRTGLDFSFERLDGAVQSLERIKNAYRNLQWQSEKDKHDTKTNTPALELKQAIDACRTEFVQSMDDDFNTAKACAALFGFVAEINQYLNNTQNALGVKTIETEACATLQELLGVFGISVDAQQDTESSDDLLPLAKSLGMLDSSEEDVKDFILQVRQSARAQKNWDQADLIRDELSSLGYLIEDTASGSRLVKK